MKSMRVYGIPRGDSRQTVAFYIATLVAHGIDELGERAMTTAITAKIFPARRECPCIAASRRGAGIYGQREPSIK